MQKPKPVCHVRDVSQHAVVVFFQIWLQSLDQKPCGMEFLLVADAVDSVAGLLVVSPHVHECVHRAGVTLFGFGSWVSIVAVGVEGRVKVNQVNDALHALLFPRLDDFLAIAVIRGVWLIV